jgi:hypothetical protein
VLCVGLVAEQRLSFLVSLLPWASLLLFPRVGIAAKDHHQQPKIRSEKASRRERKRKRNR